MRLQLKAYKIFMNPIISQAPISQIATLKDFFKKDLVNMSKFILIFVGQMATSQLEFLQLRMNLPG